MNFDEERSGFDLKESQDVTLTFCGTDCDISFKLYTKELVLLRDFINERIEELENVGVLKDENTN